MTNKQANILFIPTSIGGYSSERQNALKTAGYYEQLIYSSLARCRFGVEGFQVLGEQLASIARHAYLANQMNAVEQASQLMLALPIARRLEGVATYYRALCTWRRGDVAAARQSFERLVEESTPAYRARSLQIIGLTYHRCGELDAALRFYIAAGKASVNCDFLTQVESRRMIAVVRSDYGDHSKALADLEGLFPSVQAIARGFPVLYYDFLNSLAVELCEVGRVNEAQAACAITLASPFAHAYPEWSETRDDLAVKLQSASRSVVAIHRPPETDPARNLEPQRKSQPTRAIIASRSANNAFCFQRSLIQFPAKVIMVLNAGSILDRMLICIGPRAPPFQI